MGRWEFGLQRAHGVDADSSTGLTTRTASMLAYLGWWVTGLLFWGVERRDALVRFHAAQATITFGGLALLIGLLGLAGLVMLSYAPAGFTVFVGAAFVVWVVSVGLWLAALWQASQGKRWRIPLAGHLAEQWTRTSASASS
ncbi:MAG: DUF4870 domain-containing protein [Vicinamibacterales bacterium]